MRLVFATLHLSLVALAFVVAGAETVCAQQIEFVAPQHSDDYIAVDTLVQQTAYYGELTGFPHTFFVSGEDAVDLAVQVVEPAIESAQHTMTGIIVSQEKRGVAEVARLQPKEADWQPVRWRAMGDTYWYGPQATVTLAEKGYLVEVSNPTNDGKYVLLVGAEPRPFASGFVRRLQTIYAVKQFFEKPALSVFSSPYYYLPMLVLVVLVGWYWFYRRRHTHA